MMSSSIMYLGEEKFVIVYLKKLCEFIQNKNIVIIHKMKALIITLI